MLRGVHDTPTPPHAGGEQPAGLLAVHSPLQPLSHARFGRARAGGAGAGAAQAKENNNKLVQLTKPSPIARDNAERARLRTEGRVQRSLAAVGPSAGQAGGGGMFTHSFASSSTPAPASSSMAAAAANGKAQQQHRSGTQARGVTIQDYSSSSASSDGDDVDVDGRENYTIKAAGIQQHQQQQRGAAAHDENVAPRNSAAETALHDSEDDDDDEDDAGDSDELTYAAIGSRTARPAGYTPSPRSKRRLANANAASNVGAAPRLSLVSELRNQLERSPPPASSRSAPLRAGVPLLSARPADSQRQSSDNNNNHNRGLLAAVAGTRGASPRTVSLASLARPQASASAPSIVTPSPASPVVAAAGDGDSTVRLPDITGLTDALRSPDHDRRPLAHRKGVSSDSTRLPLTHNKLFNLLPSRSIIPDSPAPARQQKAPSPLRQASVDEHVSRRAEVDDALDELRARLASLEADKQELERELAIEQQSHRQQQRAQQSPQDKTAMDAANAMTLEALSRQVATLTSALEAQTNLVTVLRHEAQLEHEHHERERDAHATQAAEDPLDTLKRDVARLNGRLEHLANEVQGVRSVLRGVLNQRQQRFDDEVALGQQQQPRNANRQGSQATDSTSDFTYEGDEDDDATPRASARTYRTATTSAQPHAHRHSHHAHASPSFASLDMRTESEYESSSADASSLPTSPSSRGDGSHFSAAEREALESLRREAALEAATRASRSRTRHGSSTAATLGGGASTTAHRHSTRGARATTTDDEDQRLAHDMAQVKELFRSMPPSCSSSTRADAAHASKSSRALCSKCRKRAAERDGKERRSSAARKGKAKERSLGQEEETPADARDKLAEALVLLEDHFDDQKRLYKEHERHFHNLSAMAPAGQRRMLSEHLKHSIERLNALAAQVRRVHRMLHRSLDGGDDASQVSP